MHVPLDACFVAGPHVEVAATAELLRRYDMHRNATANSDPLIAKNFLTTANKCSEGGPTKTTLYKTVGKLLQSIKL
jgi:hypothetical protein